MPTRDNQIVNGQNTPLGIMARLWWMFFGNILLVFSILFIVESRGGFFHAADWVFWIALGSLVLIRYADIRFLNGCTATGTSASISHWARYTAVLIVCSAVAWILAHVANYVCVARAAQG